MNIKKTAVLLAIGLVVYWGFDTFIGWLIYKFSVGGVLLRLYPAMVLVNVMGIYCYSWVGNDFMGIEDACKKLESGKGFWRVIGQNRWLSFIVLSILPCPMAGYYTIAGNADKKLHKVVGLIGMGSVPCTLVWGGAPSLVWNSPLRWPVIIATVATILAFWIKKRIKKGGEHHAQAREEIQS